MQNFIKAFSKTIEGLKQNLPIIIGIILLISIFQSFEIFQYLQNLENNFTGVLISDLIGSIFAGNPVNSYIITGEIRNIDSHLLLINVFLISWITVGIVQMPGEIYFLGKKFSILRNLFSFVFAIIAAYIICFIYYL